MLSVEVWSCVYLVPSALDSVFLCRSHWWQVMNSDRHLHVLRLFGRKGIEFAICNACRQSVSHDGRNEKNCIGSWYWLIFTGNCRLLGYYLKNCIGAPVMMNIDCGTETEIVLFRKHQKANPTCISVTPALATSTTCQTIHATSQQRNAFPPGTVENILKKSMVMHATLSK